MILAKNYIALMIFVIGVVIGFLLSSSPPITWLCAPFIGFYFKRFVRPDRYSFSYHMGIGLLLLSLCSGMSIGGALIIFLYFHVFLSFLSFSKLEIILMILISPVLFLLGLGIDYIKNIIRELDKYSKQDLKTDVIVLGICVAALVIFVYFGLYC